MVRRSLPEQPPGSPHCPVTIWTCAVHWSDHRLQPEHWKHSLNWVWIKMSLKHSRDFKDFVWKKKNTKYTSLVIFILITCWNDNILDNWVKLNIVLKFISPFSFYLATKKPTTHVAHHSQLSTGDYGPCWDQSQRFGLWQQMYVRRVWPSPQLDSFLYS